MSASQIAVFGKITLLDESLAAFYKSHALAARQALLDLQKAAIANENVFARLMDAVRVCSLGQITTALFEVGGQYRRNM